MMERLAEIDPTDVEGWVDHHLADLFSGESRRSGAFRGGQTKADKALAELDIGGYAKHRSMVDPPTRRGASKLSPYIRHGLLELRTVHDHPSVANADSYDRFRYRSELLWQEYSRQWYAAFGRQTRTGVVYEPVPGKRASSWTREPWPPDMNCVTTTLDELHSDGWMVNQTRMWLASQWSVRSGANWRDGDDEMFRHLLDGSRAANRQGWQWVVGGVRNRSYGFAKRQVTKRAPSYCDACSLQTACPISSYPDAVAGEMIEPAPTMTLDLFGPIASQTSLFDDSRVEDEPGEGVQGDVDAVWLTAESLGDDDPALRVHPTVPAHFVFDQPLLRRLQLDGKRLVFLADCLADLAQRRDLSVWRGRPVELLDGRHTGLSGTSWAATRAPVPGFATIVRQTDAPISLKSWPWLRPPTPALVERLGRRRFPSFKDWCRLTKPATS